MIRLYVPDDLDLACPDIRLGKEQGHYLRNVMRLRDGDPVLVFNGRHGEALTTFLSGVGPKGAGVLAISGVDHRPFSPSPDLDLVVALVKRGPLETIIEKATELGVRRIRLAITRRTNADRTNVDRLRAIAIEASEQTGRLDVPEIMPPEKLERLLDGWDASRRLMFCDETGGPPALDALRDAPKDQPWAVLIGPEGGFAPEETERLRGLDFVTPVSLGPRILRADTAAISALTLWQAAVGDWAP
ncbi:MAG: rRNA ((1498)-N(3))-methyltransferase [Caulobacter sp.]|nr:rRNA ((1498)-N(3))-methyltransferase [Caulobacter sp.]